MEKDNIKGSPLVSVIIPCFNHGRYLSEALESVLSQTYKQIEIIVIDDGSTDNTKVVSTNFKNIKYFYQQNQGLSAARNTGIKNSTGDFLVFLDADDLLISDAIAFNVHYLNENKDCAFVSGGFEFLMADGRIKTKKREISTKNNYIKLLKENYIEMHGTVMYRRFVFDLFLFDTSLNACEDFDVYLKISRKFPVCHHSKLLAKYRMHRENMSGDSILMLNSAMEVFERQRKEVTNDEEKKALIQGIAHFKKFYTTRLITQLKNGIVLPNKKELEIIKEFDQKTYYKMKLKNIISRISKYPKLKKIIPYQILHKLLDLGYFKNYIPAVNKVVSGDFYRLTPFSKDFGYKRGGPVDRFYIEKFLKNSSDFIKGKVLEVADNEYTFLYGKDKIKESVVLDIDINNPKATVIADLRDALDIPDNSFDCIILTQVLHLVFEYQDVIRTCFRVLKPGGYLLLTVPGISNIDYGEFGDFWHWSFTDKAIWKIMEKEFPKDNLDINTFGNVYVATAFLYGMGLPEIKKEMLEHLDPKMQVIITVKAQKPVE